MRSLKSLGYSFYKRLFKDKTEAAIFFSALLVEIAFGLYLVQRWGFTFSCWDAVSHLYIPRAIIDNKTFNLGNLGTVWLPLFHILIMPLVLFDPLYTTGFAGTILNALMTGGVCILLYRLTGGGKFGTLASALFICNVFTLIYGSTPMTEQTAIFFMILATYYFKRYWEKDDLLAFMKCSLALLFGTLTRYEVWAVALLVASFFLIKELKVKVKRYHRLAYIHFPFWGVFAWLFWNLAIFRDPLMFLHHPRSAQAQAANSPYKFSVSTTFATSVEVLNVVIGYAWILSVGILIFYILKSAQARKTSLTCLLLLSPVPFIIMTSFIGSSFLFERHFYLGLVGLLLTPFLLSNHENKKVRSIIFVSFIVLFALAIPTQNTIVTSGHSPGDIAIPFVVHQRTEVNEIKRIIGDRDVLTHQAWYLSTLTSTSPKQIIDDYDPEYVSIMVKPWAFNVTFVVIPKLTLSEMEATNNFYEEKFYVYRYFHTPAWQNDFLKSYRLVLELDNYLVFKIETYEEYD